jgi:integrase
MGRRKQQRNRGEGGLERIGCIWYYTFYNLQGKQIRRSSKSPLKSVAIEELRKTKEEQAKGIDPTAGRKLKYAGLRSILIADYLSSGKASLDGEEVLISGRRGLLKPLDDFFGGMNVRNITTDLIREFKAKRMGEGGVLGPTVNRNLAMLRRMFRLAQREGKLSVVPYFPMEQESEPREGFLERPEFEKLRAEMPESLHPTLLFAYEVGCRTGAIKKVVWPWVNLDRKEICFPPGVLKNKKPLIAPLSDELVELLKKRFRGGPVFYMTNFRKEWNKASVKVGLGKKTGDAWYEYDGLIPHDLRRSAARNLVNSGVEIAIAMKLAGHKTLHIFLRYNIISTEQLHEAMAKVTAQNKVAK